MKFTDCIAYLLPNFFVYKDKTTAILEILEKKYKEKHRHYHSIEHIIYLWNLFIHYQYLLSLEERQIVGWSILFHDIVYEIHRKDNEEKSAEMASHYLASLPISQDICNGVTKTILATKHNYKHMDSMTSRFMMDIDIAILGQTEEIYSLYQQKVRQEYAIYPDFIYQMGRKKVLNHFLQQKNIYQLPLFQQKWETQARFNITKEINTNSNKK